MLVVVCGWGHPLLRPGSSHFDPTYPLETWKFHMTLNLGAARAEVARIRRIRPLVIRVEEQGVRIESLEDALPL